MAQKSTPKEAQVMAAILKDMGITEYEPRVINQMLEFTYRYVTDVLDDAKVYSSHANKRNLDVEDVKLAVQCKLDHSFTTPPPRDLLMELASHKNNTALPLIKPYTGPKLPPLERFCLISPNYRLKSLRKVASVRNPVQSGASLLSTLTPASRIAIQQHSGSSSIVRTGSSLGGSLSLVTLGGSQPTVTVKPAAPQTSNMPIIRFTPGSSAQTVTSSNSASFTISGSSLKRKREDDDDYDK